MVLQEVAGLESTCIGSFLFAIEQGLKRAYNAGGSTAAYSAIMATLAGMQFFTTCADALVQLEPNEQYAHVNKVQCIKFWPTREVGTC